MIDDCTAVILTGGDSRRMGRDKASLLLHGETLLDRAQRTLQPHFSTLLVSVRQRRAGLSLPQVCDPDGMAGPIAGIIAALRTIKTQWLFVIACDAPFACTSLIHAMAKQRSGQDAIAANIVGVVQPLFAFYASSCLPRMEQQIASGNRSLQRLLQQGNSTILSEAACRRHDPDLLSFMDLDTPEALKRACEIAHNHR